MRSPTFPRLRAHACGFVWSATLTGAALHAQAQLLTDLNSNLAAPGSSFPRGFCQLGSDLYFAATSPVVGRELWVADRANGARLVADLAPGARSSNPTEITPWGGGLAYIADVNGLNIYRLDFASNTRSLITLTPPRRVSNLTVAGRRLYAFIDDGLSGAELWVSPGEGLPVQPLADINASGFASPAVMVPFGPGVAMVVDDGVHGYELWVSDGTTAGTRMVRDLNPGAAWGASNTVPVMFGSELYFAGDDGAHGNELFAYDGTSIRLVADLLPGNQSSYPQRLYALGSRLTFAALDSAGRQQLAISDGRAAGTQLVPTTGEVRNSVTDATGRAWALVDVAAGRDVAVLDRSSNVVRLLGLNAAPTSASQWPVAATARGFYFEGMTGTTNVLFFSDGTLAGTLPMTNARSAVSSFAPPFADGSVMAAVFSSEAGNELWQSDGTVSGTALVADLDPTRVTASSILTFLGQIGGRTIAQDSSVRPESLIVSDGTTRGTSVLRQATARTSWRLVAELNDALLLAESDGGNRIIRTDGTAAGTSVVANLVVDNSSAPPPISAALDGQHAVFAASGSGAPTQLWISDGTPAGTRMLHAMDPAGLSLPRGFVKVGREVWFFGSDGTVPVALWATDGTAAGTRPLTGPQSLLRVPRMLGAAGNKAIFTNFQTATGAEPWVTDGTQTGTFQLIELAGGAASPSYPRVPSVMVGSRLLFQTDSGVVATDGTPAATFRVPGTRGSEVVVGMPDFAFVLGANFTRTDGSVAGTTFLPVPLPQGTVRATRSSDTRVAIGISTGPQSGLVMVSDGTTAGTAVLADNLSGPMATVDGGIVYAGFDNRHGVEPWFAATGATARAVGSGCALGAVPTLRSSEPRLGSETRLNAAQAGVVNAILFGATAQNAVRLPLPVQGCALFLDSIVAALNLPANGELRVRVPAARDLFGVRLSVQMLGLDAASAFVLSNGVRLTLGD